MNVEEESKNLAAKSCVPCRKGSSPLSEAESEGYLRLIPSWTRVGAHHLEKSYSFPDYASALAWVNQVSEIAENANHHPEITLGWGKVDVRIWTHTIDALHQNDYILAAKIDEREGSVALSK